MTTNMGTIDRILRLVAAAILLYAAFATSLLGSGALFALALGIAAIFGITAVVGMCPLYRLVGINTCRTR